MKCTRRMIALGVCALVSVAGYASAGPAAKAPVGVARALEVLGRARQEAMQLRIVPGEDLSEKGDVLLEIAALYRDLGEDVSATELLKRAERLSEESGRSRRRAHLAMAQAKAGLEEEALRTLATFTGEDAQDQFDTRSTFKDKVLQLIMRHRLARRDIEGALAAAAQMTERMPTGSRPRDNAYKEIVLTQWERGDIAAARKNINLVGLPWIRDELLQELIAGRLKRGDFKEPLVLIKMIHYPSHKIDPLIQIAVAEAKRGDRKAAEERFAEATTIASALVPFDVRGYVMQLKALCDIAVGRARAGDPEAAKTLKRTVEEAKRVAVPMDPDAARYHLAAAYAGCRLIEEAVKTAEAIHGLPTKALAFASIAAAAAEAGQQTAAEANWQMAVKAAGSIRDSGLSDWTIRSLVTGCIEAGRLKLALQLAGKIGVQYEKYSERDAALLEVLEAYAQRQEVQQALAVQAKMKIPHMRRRANQRIAEAKIRAGDLAGAAALVKATEKEGGGTEILKLMQTLVQAQIKAGDFSGAAATARFVNWVGYTDRALRNVATAQARSGDLQGALALVSEGDYGLRKACIWLGAARGLAQRHKAKPPARKGAGK